MRKIDSPDPKYLITETDDPEIFAFCQEIHRAEKAFEAELESLRQEFNDKQIALVEDRNSTMQMLLGAIHSATQADGTIVNWMLKAENVDFGYAVFIRIPDQFLQPHQQNQEVSQAVLEAMHEKAETGGSLN